jgi:cyclophilin family peptidyl-prolyl cis-trans isomerase
LVRLCQRAPSLRRRYPYQPEPGVLQALPRRPSSLWDDGELTLKLLTDVAPVTVARFAELANARLLQRPDVPPGGSEFFVQGGSPGANDFSGTSRYMRDEVGPQGVHVRGAVGIMTRGGDTGNGQIFIDLIDAPSLDRDYTVFAYVTQGMEYVDRILEGAKIKGVTVR